MNDETSYYIDSSMESVIQVAYDTGFCDQSHFDRCFKKIVGMSPIDYLGSIHNQN